MGFRVLGTISGIETIATGRGIRMLMRLQRLYGRGKWRKRKGTAVGELDDGTVGRAELHWYEATGIVRRAMKIKRML